MRLLVYSGTDLEAVAQHVMSGSCDPGDYRIACLSHI